jgi:hypothetical protein
MEDINDYNLSINKFNLLSELETYEELLRCCGSPSWARSMCSNRPYPDLQTLLDKANTIWWNQPVEEWLKAFSAHPKIGICNNIVL